MRLPFATRRYQAGVVFGGLAIQSLALALPILMMQLYDRVLPNGSVATLTWLAIVTVSALVLEAVLKSARNSWALWHAEMAVFQARRSIMDTLLASPWVASRAREVFPALKTLLYDSYLQLSFFTAEVPFGVLYLGLVYLIHPVLSLVLLGLGLSLMLFLRAIRPLHARLKKERTELVERRDQYLETVFGDIAALKSLGAEELVDRHYAHLHAALEVNEARMATLETWKTAWTKAVDLFSVFGPLIVGGVFVVEGQLTVGALTACVLLARRTVGPLQRVAERWYQEIDLQEARRKVYPVLRPRPGQNRVGSVDLPTGESGELSTQSVTLRQGIEPSVTEGLPAASGPLELTGDDEILLRVEDVSFGQGARVVFGPELPASVGSFLAAIRGTDPYFSGEVLWSRQPLSRYATETIGRRIALVAEESVLFPGTFLENLASFDVDALDDAREAGRVLGLDSFFEGLERGYETMVSPTQTTLASASVLQRFGLARALTRRPAVLLLDGFDAVLDAETRRVCRSAIEALTPHATVLYRGSDPAWLRSATHRAFVRDGVLAFEEVQP